MEKKGLAKVAVTRWRFLEPMGLMAAVIVWLTLAMRWWVPIQDPDLWWLMWAGDSIYSGSFPYYNQISYTAPDVPWVLHEPIVALVYSAVGVENIIWIRCLILGLTGMMLLSLARCQNGWATVLALSPLPVLLYFSLSERAVAWGTLLLALMVYLLERRSESWRFAAAAALVVVWANVHGSFVLGVILLGSLSWRWGGIAALGACLNPNGPGLYGLLGQYGLQEGLQGGMAAYIPEWAPLDPFQPSQAVALVWLIGVSILLFRQPDWRKRLVGIVCGLLMIRAWRFAPMAAIVLLPWVVDELERRLPQRPLGNPLPALGCLLLVTLALSGNIGQRSGFYPERMLDDIPVTGRMWSDHLYGGWLGYHGYEVFWDGRNDCYPAEVFSDGLSIAFVQDGWAGKLNKWGIDLVMTRREPLARALEEADWRQLIESEGIYLFERQ